MHAGWRIPSMGLSKNSTKLKKISIWKYVMVYSLYTGLLIFLLLFSHSVVFDSQWPHGLQHPRLPCPPLSPGVCSNSCPVTWWCHTAISSSAAPFPFAFSLSQHQGSATKLVLQIRWPKYWSFSISPSNKYSGLISFKTDWFDRLAVQQTLKSLLQHHSLKASILWCSAFLMVQISHSYMTTGKTIALNRQMWLDGKVMSLLFNTLSRFVTVFLIGSHHLLI